MNKVIAALVLTSSVAVITTAFVISYRAADRRRRIKEAETLGPLLGVVYKNRKNF